MRLGHSRAFNHDNKWKQIHINVPGQFNEV